MNVGAPSQLPPSSQLVNYFSDKAKENVVSGSGPVPEDVARAVHAAEDKAVSAQQQAAAQSQLKRDVVVSINSAQQQQQVLEIYAYNNRGEELSLSSPAVQNISSMMQNQQRADRAEVIQARPEQAADSLRQLIEQIERPQIQPLLNIQA